MALIKSISGIRGTIGGIPGESLTAIDVVKFTASYGNIIAERREDKSQPTKIIVGRDGRISGEMVSQLVINTLVSLGVNVIDLGLSTTPTVEIATKNVYRQYGYGNPDMYDDRFVEAKNILSILRLINEEFGVRKKFNIKYM